MIYKKQKISINSILNCTLIIVLVALSIMLISSKSQLGYDIVGYRSYTVLSGSMEPTYYPGDVVIIKNKNRVNLSVNDVVTFKEDDKIITHRISEIIDKGYITKGDNNELEDDNILAEEDIIGKVVFKIPKVGYIIEFLAKPYMIAVEMIILAVVILLYVKD